MKIFIHFLIYLSIFACPACEQPRSSPVRPENQSLQPSGAGPRDKSLDEPSPSDDLVRTKKLMAAIRDGRRGEKGLVSDLIDEFRTGFLEHDLSCVVAMGMIGKDAKEAIPIIEGARVGWIQVRDIIYWKPLWTSEQDAIDFFKKKNWQYTRSDAPDRDVCLYYVSVSQILDSVLNEIGPADKEFLKKSLNDKREEIRVGAAFALVKTDLPFQKLAVPIFINVILDRSESPLRAKAAEALGRIGTDAKEAIPVLSALLNDMDVTLRKTAFTALEKIK